MNKQDRRAIRTRKRFHDAIVELIEEKGFDAITIRDITDRADVAYATFYRHYESREELLLERMDDIIQELESLATQGEGSYFQKEGTLIFEHIRENSDFYGRIFESKTVGYYLQRRFASHILAQLSRHIPPDVVLPIPPDILANHMAAALVALIDWWFTNRQPHEPEKMGEFYEKLIIQASWSVVPPEYRPA